MGGYGFVAQRIGAAKSAQEVSQALAIIGFHTEHPTIAGHYWYPAAT